MSAIDKVDDNIPVTNSSLNDPLKKITYLWSPKSAHAIMELHLWKLIVSEITTGMNKQKKFLLII